MNSIADRLQSIASIPPTPSVHGHWFNIRICPDLALGELLNVGVGYIDAATEKIHTKVIDQFDRFRTLYGDGFEDEVRMMLHVLESSLSRNRWESPTPNIRFSEAKFAAGNSIEDVLDSLYQTTIVLPASDGIKEAQAREASAGNDAVRKLVFNELKKIIGLSAERIISSDPIYTAVENGKTYALDIPLRGKKHLGSIVSAKYKTMHPIEANLLRATIDIETASKIFKHDRLGVFVVRPSGDPISYPNDRLAQIDNIIDNIGWKLHKQGIHVGVEDEPTALAADIASWAEIQA